MTSNYFFVDHESIESVKYLILKKIIKEVIIDSENKRAEWEAY